MKATSVVLGAVLAFLPRLALADEPTKPPPPPMYDVLVQQLEDRNAKRDAALDEEAKAAQREGQEAFDKARADLARHKGEDVQTGLDFDRDVRLVKARSLHKFAIGSAAVGGGLVVLAIVAYAPGLVARSQLEGGGLATGADQETLANRMSSSSAAGGALATFGILGLAFAGGCAIAELVIAPPKARSRTPPSGARFEGGKLAW